LNRRGRVNQNNLMFKWISTAPGTGHDADGGPAQPSNVWYFPGGPDTAARSRGRLAGRDGRHRCTGGTTGSCRDVPCTMKHPPASAPPVPTGFREYNPAGRASPAPGHPPEGPADPNGGGRSSLPRGQPGTPSRSQDRQEYRQRSGGHACYIAHKYNELTIPAGRNVRHC